MEGNVDPNNWLGRRGGAYGTPPYAIEEVVASYASYAGEPDYESSILRRYSTPGLRRNNTDTSHERPNETLDHNPPTP
jgi:hypothetical protein